MNETQTLKMIDFRRFTPEDKPLYESFFADTSDRGCECSFANLYLWGRQNFAVIHDHIAIFSQFNRRSVYPYPIGKGDKRAVLDAIIADARARGIPCRGPHRPRPRRGFPCAGGAAKKQEKAPTSAWSCRDR